MHSDEPRVERDHLREGCRKRSALMKKLALIRVSLALNVRFTPKSGHWLSPLGCPLCATSVSGQIIVTP
jgi:hypothetical protein